ncbi:hypothetical protein BCR33DRAFT_856560 [Rhizoclosmatium globosum]|uniref:S-adenosyl-L-methionine-dependent methyltransferase n=1 Tax=Rhizoclosmatium globosum TaxID=329046 RepID=A0A1Y2BCP9_9FUNG|nr:hypothetical protein BCR33DRAFT_856560 [Rhizoclosmatium globosum]|eukprot:ORY32486.1 hypothetical protein BCR33DRAFT_856560 [Rhizoclosmatium globosum]
MSLSESHDAFLTANAAFLRSAGLVDPLIDEVWKRIETGQLGTGHTNPFGIDEEGTVVTVEELSPRDCVFVYAHQWVFANVMDAAKSLSVNKGLCSAVADLIGVAMDTRPSAEEAANKEDFALKNLFRVAFEFDVEGGDKLNCVSLDPYAPALLPFAQSPLLGAVIFVDARTATSYTVLWPNWIDTVEEVDDPELTLEQYSPITRGELVVMPDPSSEEYWKLHYATMKDTNTFDWYMPWSEDLSHVIKQAVATVSGSNKENEFITVLNVGCGNSTSVGDGLMDDKICDLVMHYDVSKEVVHALSKLEQESVASTSKKPTAGVQEYIVFDASDPAPFRTRFSWAFDKGTFDGMLSHGAELVKKVWANLAKVTDTVVLVSHGSPEKRIQVIEEQVAGGWTVDQCLEIDTTKTTGWCYWVYICKHSSEK